MVFDTLQRLLCVGADGRLYLVQGNNATKLLSDSVLGGIPADNGLAFVRGGMGGPASTQVFASLVDLSRASWPVNEATGKVKTLALPYTIGQLALTEASPCIVRCMATVTQSARVLSSKVLDVYEQVKVNVYLFVVEEPSPPNDSLALSLHVFQKSRILSTLGLDHCPHSMILANPLVPCTFCFHRHFGALHAPNVATSSSHA